MRKYIFMFEDWNISSIDRFLLSLIFAFSVRIQLLSMLLMFSIFVLGLNAHEYMRGQQMASIEEDHLHQTNVRLQKW